MRRLVWIVCLIGTAGARGQGISEQEAQIYAASWLKGNPLAIRYRQAQGLALEVGQAERLTLDGLQPPFYLIHLKPRGYIIMNSDDRLRPVIGFSFSGSPDLKKQENDALHQFLLAHARTNVQDLAVPGPALSAWARLPSLRILNGEEGDVIGPLLATFWDQGNHYNEFCPLAAGAPDSSDGRAAAGCVATAFAQVMRYHEWPYRGAGSFTYEDTAGAITGTHTAVFSDPYEWSRMQNEYYAFGREPNEAVQAVAELMYELGVAAKTNYEAAGSSAASAELAGRLRRCFLYETPLFVQAGEGVSLVDALLSDLARYRPCAAGVPGHGVVIDGHMRQGTDDFFHINYGWSGRNDGWYLLDDVQGRPITEICTGIDPLLVAIPLGGERTAEGWELQWVLPEMRADEVSRVDVLRRMTVSGTWAEPAEDFDEFRITSTSDYGDWVLSPGGYTSTCFHKPAGGYLNREYHLTSSRMFQPGSDTLLAFKAQYKVYEDRLSVLVSSDNGDSFTPVWSVSKEIRTNWTDIQVPLGAWAGQDILIRFEYVPGKQSYIGGGVWLDDIRLVAAQWYEWSVIHQVHALEAYRAESTVVFEDRADAFGAFQVTSTDSHLDWSLSAEGFEGGCFYKPVGGYNHVRYHVTSTRVFEPTPQTQLTLKARYALGQDALSVLVSTDGGGSFSPVWSVTDTIREHWTDMRIPLDAFAGQQVLIRFEYIPGAYYPDTGVWIDEIRLVDVTGAEYLDDPVYHTSLTHLDEGIDFLAYQVWTGDQPHPRSEPFTLDSGL